MNNSHEVEQAVLGCCLTEPLCIAESQLRILNEEFFYDVRHQTIWEHIIAEPRHANLITVQKRLKDSSLLENVGGIGYLIELQNIVPSIHHLSVWLEELEASYTRRKLSAVAKEIEKLATGNHDLSEVLDAVEKMVLAVRPQNKANADIRTLVRGAIDILEARCLNPDTMTGYSTGLIDLDRLTDGIHHGEMIVVAGFPSTGKTALAVNIATHNALAGVPVGIYSAEMLPVQLAVRQLCSTAKANAKRLVEFDIPRLTDMAGKLSNAPIHIENASGMTIGQLTASARRMSQKHGIKIFVVDYIGLILGKGDNREQQIASISKGIKSMAMELNCAVLALSQLNDDGKLRESRAPGQDADSVWKLLNDGDWQKTIQPIKLNVEKCRDGETGVIDLIFKKEHTRFENASKSDL